MQNHNDLVSCAQSRFVQGSLIIFKELEVFIIPKQAIQKKKK